MFYFIPEWDYAVVNIYIWRLLLATTFYKPHCFALVDENYVSLAK